MLSGYIVKRGYKMAKNTGVTSWSLSEIYILQLNPFNMSIKGVSEQQYLRRDIILEDFLKHEIL